jgi:NAD(P)-dependent dehydrogenase (short-subunit alcohol dehydrogenase family)
MSLATGYALAFSFVKPLAIITGASSGLGLQSAKALAAKGFDITMIARGEQRLIEAAQTLREDNPDICVSEVVLDISNLDTVREFAKTVTTPVEILMNNAGLMGPDFSLSIEGIESQMATNHLGHFLLTNLLWGKLNKANNPKVISLSSVVHRRGKLIDASITEVKGSNPKNYDRWQRYADSKLACTYFGRELDIRARQSGSKVKSIISHPGWAVTGLQKNFPNRFDRFAQDAKTGAQSQIQAALDDEIASGEFIGPRYELWGAPKLIKGSQRSKDQALSQALWSSSEELTGANFLG